MACILTTGRKLPCKDAVGGITEVYFADYGTLGTATITAGVVTNFAGIGVADLFKFDVKSASGLEQTITSSTDNGTTFYEQTITMVLTKLDALTQEALQTLIVGRPNAFIKDNNGNYLAVGMTRGCDITGTINTGVALGDLVGYTLTITGQEPLMAQFVAPLLITANTSPTQIAP